MARLISGVLLAAAAVAAILFLPTFALRLLATVVAAVAATEYLRIVNADARLFPAAAIVCWVVSGPITAAGLALPVQVAAFAALRWGWSRRNHFLAAWVAGMLARVVLVGVGLVLVLVSGLPPAPTLLALASFLFAMLLIEPFFISKEIRGGRP